jgi:hypothetical protein
LTNGLDPSAEATIGNGLGVTVTCREPLMVQLMTADFLDLRFIAVVAVAIVIAILIVWMNKQ